MVIGQTQKGPEIIKNSYVGIVKARIKMVAMLGVALVLGACQTQKSLSLKSKDNVIQTLTKVNDKWQSDHDASSQNAFWHPATYHIGNLAAYHVTRDQQYLDYSLEWAKSNEWMGAKSTNPDEWKFTYGETDQYVLFGDWQACFQVYIDLYKLDPKDQKIARAREVMSYQVSTDENKYWWWIDGLFMVMPVMPRMYELTKDEIYLEKLHEYYQHTKSLVLDEETGLLYRDAKYIYPKHTTNSGKKDFWSRGNGWVFAALARTLDELPKSDPHYSEYLDDFLNMAKTLKNSQQKEGYWTRSLLDTEQAPGPETSGTSFFTFGMLWGMNNGVLSKEEYQPVIARSWRYLSEVAVQPDGTLGYVQPIGERAIPGQVVDQNSTSDFGVGAFLLAASEMVKFLNTTP